MKIIVKSILGKILIDGDFSSLAAALFQSDADLCGANLRDADLCDANLRGANLCGTKLCDANLRGANLRSADLCGADLCGANLCDANLCGANLRGADLCGANLCDANLCGANLCDANLRGAKLCDANLRGANLRDADLCDANLCGANLRGANLCGADLRGAKNAEYAIAQTRILPEGDLIGWKQCRDGVLVKLKIPAGAKRSHAFGRKCRAEFAEVLEVIGAKVGISSRSSEFVYEVGKTVRPGPFCEDWQQECASGIHFFITKIEAEKYVP